VKAERRPRTTELDELGAQLRASNTVRVTLAQLWEMWAAAAPRLLGSPAQAAELAEALTELERRQIVELPKRAWDRSTTPPLPRSVRVSETRPAPRKRQWLSYPWCRELGWASSLTFLEQNLFDDLVAIDHWLRHRAPTAPVVPMRYRSAEIFGDEKRLEVLARSSLFREGRLTLELLACVRRPPPLPAAAVGAGPDVLVVENSDPFWAAVEVLSQHDAEHPVGAVVWGSGNSFPSQVGSLAADVAGRGPVTGSIWYWGDLDPPGITIATNAAATAAELNMPPVEPAHALWETMADHPAQAAGHHQWPTTFDRHWLGKPLWDRFAHIRSKNARVAQESIAPEAIAEWARALPR